MNVATVSIHVHDPLQIAKEFVSKKLQQNLEELFPH